MSGSVYEISGDPWSGCEPGQESEPSYYRKVWKDVARRGYCGTGGKPAGNREDEYEPTSRLEVLVKDGKQNRS